MVEADIIIQKIMCEKALMIGMAFVANNLYHCKHKKPVLHPLAPSMAMLECGCWQEFWKFHWFILSVTLVLIARSCWHCLSKGNPCFR